MRAKTKEEFQRMFESRSGILNPPSNDPKQLPRTSGHLIYGLAGMQAELDAILDKEIDEQGRYHGHLNYAKAMAKEARENWIAYRNSQLNLSKDEKPTGEFAENINKWDAKVTVLEKESRKLVKMIEELSSKQEEEEKKAKSKRRPSLSGKSRNGKLYIFSGREVIQNEEDEDIFKDNGELVKEFVKREIARRKAEGKKRRKNNVSKKKRSAINF